MRLRPPLVVAVAILMASAVVYFHPWSRPATPPAPAPVNTLPSAARTVWELQVLDDRVAWAVVRPSPNGRSIVDATENAGRTWHQVLGPTGGATGGLQLLDRTHVFLDSATGLMATRDGGRTWHRVPLPSGQTVPGNAHFLTPLQGWYQDASGDTSGTQQPTTMWWTVNGGATWEERWRVDAQHPNEVGLALPGSKYVLGFRDADHGWMSVFVGGLYRLFATADGGRQWAPVDLPGTGPGVVPAGLDFLPDGGLELLETALPSGRIVLSSRDGLAWDGPRKVPFGFGEPRYGGDNRVSFTDATHWALADTRMLHVTSDAGQAWQDVEAALPAGISTLRDVWLLSGGKGWATAETTGTRRSVLTTSDSGRHWVLASPMS